MRDHTIPGARGRTSPGFWLLAVALIAGLAAEGCRSKLDVTDKSAPKKPAVAPPPPKKPDAPPVVPPTPKEVLDGLSLQQTQYQPGQVVYILLKTDLLQPGSVFSIVNTTNSKEIIPSQNFAGEGDYNGYSIERASDANWVLVITPKLLEEQGALEFTPYLDIFAVPMVGTENVIKLSVDDAAGSNPRFATTRIVIAGFRILENSIAFFDSGAPVENTAGDTYQYQGWVNVLQAPQEGIAAPTAVVAPPDTNGVQWLLSAGMHNMLQR